MQRRLLVNVGARDGAPVLQLLSCKDEALLVRRDILLVLDLLLHVLNRVRRLHIQRDGHARQQRLDKSMLIYGGGVWGGVGVGVVGTEALAPPTLEPPQECA